MAVTSEATGGLKTWLPEYAAGDLKLTGYAACPEGALEGSLGGVLVAHTAIGHQEDFIYDRVHVLARAGYVAFALDMFGAGECVFGEAKNEANRQLKDRSVMKERALAAVSALQAVPEVDKTRIGAVGYCLGGKVVIDLARSSPPGLQSVVSFHGILDRPDLYQSLPISAKVLVYHGSKDPYIPPDSYSAFVAEMEDKQVDCQLVVLPGLLHSFTRSEKVTEQDLAIGQQYSATHAVRTWKGCMAFLHETL